MLVASAAERRYGAAVAGMVAAAPVSLTVIVLAVGADGGALAASAGAHVIAQVAFALVFAAVIRRGGLAGLCSGTVAFAAVSAAITTLPPFLATTAAIPALLLAPRYLKGSDPFRFEDQGSDPLGAGLV